MLTQTVIEGLNDLAGGVGYLVLGISLVWLLTSVIRWKTSDK